MLDELIRNIVKQMKEDYPQLECPGAMKAKIVSAKKTDETYKRSIFLKDVTAGEKREYEIELERYVYSVRILDNTGNTLEDYPVLPGIKSRDVYEVGEMVTVVFTGGEINPVIVGG